VGSLLALKALDEEAPIQLYTHIQMFNWLQKKGSLLSVT
jgi:hypothetical protein